LQHSGQSGPEKDSKTLVDKKFAATIYQLFPIAVMTKENMEEHVMKKLLITPSLQLLPSIAVFPAMADPYEGHNRMMRSEMGLWMMGPGMMAQSNKTNCFLYGQQYFFPKLSTL